MKRGLGRRELLRGLGVVSGLAPLVPALDGWAGEAKARPKRLLLAFSSNGMVPERF